MTTIEVTPEVLEAVAHAALVNEIDAKLVLQLREWAGHLRGQAAETDCYVEELARTLKSGERDSEYGRYFYRYETLDEPVRLGTLAGIRAVLERLDRDGRLVREGAQVVTDEAVDDLWHILELKKEADARADKAEAALAALLTDLSKALDSLREQADGLGTFNDGHESLCYAEKLVQQAYAKAVQA